MRSGARDLLLEASKLDLSQMERDAMDYSDGGIGPGGAKTFGFMGALRSVCADPLDRDGSLRFAVHCVQVAISELSSSTPTSSLTKAKVMRRATEVASRPNDFADMLEMTLMRRGMD